MIAFRKLSEVLAVACDGCCCDDEDDREHIALVASAAVANAVRASFIDHPDAPPDGRISVDLVLQLLSDLV